MCEITRPRKTAAFRTGVAVGITLSVLSVRMAAVTQTSQSRTETKSFEIVSVDRHTVVIKDADGAHELTVPEGFRVEVAGKKVPVSELKPGMKGRAAITTTVTEKKVYVTEVKQARIHRIVGRNIIVMMKDDTSYRMFTQSDAEKSGRTIIQNGKPLDWETLRVGDILTATIVTEGPPQVMTAKQVEVKMAEAAKPASAVVSPTPPAPSPAPATESGWNPLLVGGIGAVSLIAVLLFRAMSR